MCAIGLSVCFLFYLLCQNIPYVDYSPVQFVASGYYACLSQSYRLLLVDCAYLSAHTCHIYLCRPLLSSHVISVCLVMTCVIPILWGHSVPVTYVVLSVVTHVLSFPKGFNVICVSSFVTQLVKFDTKIFVLSEIYPFFRSILLFSQLDMRQEFLKIVSIEMRKNFLY